MINQKGGGVASVAEMLFKRSDSLVTDEETEQTLDVGTYLYTSPG